MEYGKGQRNKFLHVVDDSINRLFPAFVGCEWYWLFAQRYGKQTDRGIFVVNLTHVGGVFDRTPHLIAPTLHG